MFKNVIKIIPGAKWLAHKLGMIPKLASKRRFLLEMLPKNSVGVEIGVHLGDFSQQILEVIYPKELHLVDPWEHHTSDTYKNAWYGGKVKNGQKEMEERYANVCARFDPEIRRDKVKVHRGYSTDILDQFPDGFFDWVYIDGNHLYENVKKDIELSFRKIKVGGFLTGDDYTDSGWWEGGVKKAVDEFLKTQVAQLVEIRNEQFIFCKKS